MNSKEEIKYMKKIAKVQKEFIQCMDKNCKVVAKNYKILLQSTSNEFKEIFKSYDENKIKEKELLLKIITILKKNLNDIKYTNYIKCLIKNCYKNYKNYIDLLFLSLNNPTIQKIILLKAKEYNVDNEVRNFFDALKGDNSTLKKIKMTAKLCILVLEKLYKNNESLIVKTIKENKSNIKSVIQQIV